MSGKGPGFSGLRNLDERTVSKIFWISYFFVSKRKSRLYCVLQYILYIAIFRFLKNVRFIPFFTRGLRSRIFSGFEADSWTSAPLSHSSFIFAWTFLLYFCAMYVLYHFLHWIVGLRIFSFFVFRTFSSGGPKKCVPLYQNDICTFPCYLRLCSWFVLI